MMQPKSSPSGSSALASAKGGPALFQHAWLLTSVVFDSEHHRFTKVSAILLAMAATLLACGALAYVQFVRPRAAFSVRAGALGMRPVWKCNFFGSVSE